MANAHCCLWFLWQQTHQTLEFSHSYRVCFSRLNAWCTLFVYVCVCVHVCRLQNHPCSGPVRVINMLAISNQCMQTDHTQWGRIYSSVLHILLHYTGVFRSPGGMILNAARNTDAALSAGSITLAIPEHSVRIGGEFLLKRCFVS